MGCITFPVAYIFLNLTWGWFIPAIVAAYAVYTLENDFISKDLVVVRKIPDIDQPKQPFANHAPDYHFDPDGFPESTFTPPQARR